MDWLKEDISLFWSEEETAFDDNSTSAWNVPIAEEAIDERWKIEEKGEDTTYFEKKEQRNSTEIPVELEPVELGILVREYENWEGRVVSIGEEIIRARIVNTQRIYSPRMLQISKSIFTAKGISKKISVGDMFELTFKHVRIEFQTKEKKLRQREENIDTIRMIEQTRLTRKEIEDIVSKELQSLSYLFE